MEIFMSKVDFVIVGNQRITRRSNGTYLVEHLNTEKSMTQQCFSDAADVNKIMARWLSGNGENPHCMPDFTRFRDVSNGMDYQTLKNVVLEAQGDFDTLPADVRARFKNDPALLISFVSDPANASEAIALGLLDADLGTNLADGGSSMAPPEQSSLDVTVRTDTNLGSV
jgi:hypothetical protein